MVRYRLFQILLADCRVAAREWMDRFDKSWKAKNNVNRFQQIVWMALLIGTGATFTEAQQADGLSFGGSVDLPGEGLSFRILRGAEPLPLPQPTVSHARSPTGAVEERYDPRILWYEGGYLGRWRDSAGSTMTAGVVGNLLPERLARPRVLVTREAYAQVLAEDATQPPQNMEELLQWAGTFAGARVKGEPQAVQTNPRLSRAMAIEFEESATKRGYLFQFIRNAHGVDPYQWFLVLFELAQGTDMEAAERAIVQDFVGSLATIQRTATRPPPTTSRRILPPGTAAVRERSPVYQASRERAAASIRGLDTWWLLETDHYIILSDLTGGRRTFVNLLKDELDTLRGYFERVIPPLAAIDAVSLVRVFANQTDYQRYVGPDHQWSGGIWVPSKGELVIRVIEGGSERQRRDLIASVVYHEALHQYLFYAFNAISTSVWYNEGHATFFEGAEVRRDTVQVDEVPRYAALMEAMAQCGGIPVDRMLAMSYPAFYQAGGNDRQRREHYALAWGLVYYLRKGAPLEPGNTYEEVLPRYADALWETRSAERATARAFEGVDMDAFQKAFTAFWGNRTLRNRARRNNDLT